MATARKLRWWERLRRWLTLPGDGVTPRVVVAYLAGVVGLTVAHLGGLLVPVLVHGGAIVYAMLALMGVHLAYAVYTARALDCDDRDYDTIGITQLRTTWLSYMDDALPGLGFVGTLIGAIRAFGAIDTAGGPEGIAPMVGQVLTGLSFAIYTTLAGVVLMLWSSVVTRLIFNAAERLKR